MLINPVLVGVIGTLFVEGVALVAALIIWARKVAKQDEIR